MRPAKTFLMHSEKGNLILIPCPLTDGDLVSVLPSNNLPRINSCSTFIVENLRSARRFLIKAGIKTKIDDLQFHTLNKHTPPEALSLMLDNAVKGENIGLISEAGCPGVADPGAEIVALAHKKQIPVQPLVGPSSILLALMASGMNGQQFAFNGYLPKGRKERIKNIQWLEQLSKKNNQTQIFIETPYRNNHLINDLSQYCHPNTYVSIACNLTSSEEKIIRTKAKDLKAMGLDLNKKPTVFLIHAY